MKKLLLSSLLLIAFTISNAQSVNSVTVVAPSPTTNDLVKVVVNTTFGFNCISKTINVNIVGNQIQVYIQKCLGLLTTVCTENDTANVGLLPAGTYIVYVFLSYAQANPTCITYTPPLPSTQIFTFMVSPFVSVPETKNNLSLNVFPNPAQGDIQFSLSSAKKMTLEIYNLVGEKIKTYSIAANSSKFIVKEGELKSGIYFAKLISEGTEPVVQKFIITD